MWQVKELKLLRDLWDRTYLGRKINGWPIERLA
jgi:hypothetical protein